MHTSTLSFSNVLNRQRLAIVIGAGVLALAAATAGRAYLDIQDAAVDRVVELTASFKAAPDLATLKSDADVVVVGHIVGQGTTRLISQSGNSGTTAPAPAPITLDPKKADAVKLEPAAPGVSTTTTVANANLGTPVTTYTIQVERSAKGSAANRISITQLGGHVTLDTYPGGPKLERTVEFEGDHLMQAGDRAVMFLKKAADGSFFVAAGPQGRLSVDKADKVHPVDDTAPALKGHTGETLEGFLAAVAAAK